MLYLLLPLLAICAILVCLGAYLIVRSVKTIHACDRRIGEMKDKWGGISGLIE